MPALDITALRDAINQLSAGLAEAEREPENELLRDGVIQRFEYSHESAMKFIRRTLETVFGDAVDQMAYNDVLRTAAERGLITNVEGWFSYRVARNKTSHIYDVRVAAEVYTVAKPFLDDARFLLTQLDAAFNRPSA
jgi:nucleotidyltransferase substrate binding protein (TIGR01987 family)